MRHKLTPGQKLWIEVFGVYGLPKLDDDKVLAIVDQLPPRHAQAVRLRFGFKGAPLTYEEMGRSLLRLDERGNISRETARKEIKRALRGLQRPKWRQCWNQAKR
jgi:DNA-directed RNA polymerase sigma subunit (sigma70/sigma32)